MTQPTFLIVDLFCGAGGTTTGFEMTNGIAKVIACVNHDPKAIESHWKNHPGVVHFEEDIRTLKLQPLRDLVHMYRSQFPDALLILWASLECTNFSKAKGGQPRDADSRTLADHLDRYVLALKPDYVQVENVVEFMSWGPLDDNGKPLSRKSGQDYVKWRDRLCTYGYHFDWKELNSADFGAFTSRNRLFGCFAKGDLPICWPQPTHAKKVHGGMFGKLEKWKPVKEVLDFEDQGISIFNRKKPLSDKTLERIYAGLIKYVANGDTSFISKYYSGRPAGKNISVDGPAGTITTIDSQALVQAQFLLQTYAANSKGHNTFSVDQPARTVTTRDSTQLVQADFLAAYYGNGDNVSSVDSPCPTIPTKDRFQLVQPDFLLNYNHSSKVNDINEPAPTLLTRDKLAKVNVECLSNSQNQSIDQPAGTIMPNDKHRLVTCEPFIMPTNFDNKPTSIESPLPTITANRKYHYIVNPSHGGHSTSTDAPCPVIVARQDKAPLYLVEAEGGYVAIAAFDCDSEVMIRIKYFMCVYGLVDIKMRMLKVPELLKIQGFPEDYVLEGTQADHKNFIGNSVHPILPKAWALAMDSVIATIKQKVA